MFYLFHWRVLSLPCVTVGYKNIKISSILGYPLTAKHLASAPAQIEGAEPFPASKGSWNVKGGHLTLTGCCFKDVILSGSATGNPTMGFKSSNVISTLSLMERERERERATPAHLQPKQFLQTLYCVILSQGGVRKMCFTTWGRRAATDLLKSARFHLSSQLGLT